MLSALFEARSFSLHCNIVAVRFVQRTSGASLAGVRNPSSLKALPFQEKSNGKNRPSRPCRQSRLCLGRPCRSCLGSNRRPAGMTYALILLTVLTSPSGRSNTDASVLDRGLSLSDCLSEISTSPASWKPDGYRIIQKITCQPE